jgi:hypothetical protein
LNCGIWVDKIERIKMNIGKIEILKGDIWEEISFLGLKEGDIFRMFNLKDKEILNKNDNNIFKAKSNLNWKIN